MNRQTKQRFRYSKMGTELTVGAQALGIMRRAGARFTAIGHTAVNHAAYELQKWSQHVVGTQSALDVKIFQAIKVKRSNNASVHPRAVVFVDGASCPEAVYTHERYHSITVKPKVTMFLWIPLTAAGRSHVLHAHDSVAKRLKGWMVAGEKSRPVGYWPELQSGMYHGVDMGSLVNGTQLDFMLKRSVNLPASRHAGFLVKTAERMRPNISADITATFNREISRMGKVAA